ncbi:hypothetical protein [Micromonospora pallida]|uniref:hypothetical protein n=1 Tax=Micromonospora pallida TaxID=145854 RepID=UPI00114C9BE2|nr:hypothetical protein [Micromonospora pallida]
MGGRRDTGLVRKPAPDSGSHVVVLVKPELLGAAAEEAMTEVVRVLGSGEVDILRCAVMPAADFSARGALLRHYPRLHRVAADGAAALAGDARRALEALTATSGRLDVLGAYAALDHDANLSAATLETRCREAGITKLGSGSYASTVEVLGRPIVVLNGFLPALADAYRQDRGALVGLLECHSDREVGDLRSGLLGALHPGQAAPGSLRGAAGAVAGRHGIELSEGRNGVHLSAGHLEGMLQAWRYFAAADGCGVDSTALGRALVGHGVPTAFITGLAADHNLPCGPADTVAPHGATESLSRDEVIGLVRRWATTTPTNGRVLV